jgi:HEAT repeat protein
MGKSLRLLFNLHAGEGRKASLFIILGLLWSVGSYGSFVLSEGMFLEHVGAQALPKIYFAIAIAMCLLSAILLFALNRFSVRSLLIFIISLWIFTNLTFFLLYPLYSHTSTYWYIYKTVGWITPISTYILYWAFVDQYYDLQDGKRFFALFNSTTFLGDALGGGLIAYCLDLVGVRGLISLFIGALVASLPFIFIITRRHTPLLEEPIERVDNTTTIDLKGILQTTLTSKFTLYLIFFYFAMQLLATVTEFNYMNTYGRVFVGAPENTLTEFNGRIGMWISLGNMIFGMFAYSRLVKKIGINNLILIAPSFFCAIFSFWFFKDALAIAIFGMVAREGMVYSFDDNNLNLLITGVPTKIKNQIRIAVESFIEPSGMFAAAGLLLLFQNHAPLLGLVIALSALAIVFFLRTSYPRAIFRNLVASSIRFDKTVDDYLKQFSNKELKKTEFLLFSNFKLSGEKGQLIAYEYLLKIGNPRVLPRLLNHIGKLSLPGKLKAIELFSESQWAKEPLVLERLERWRRIFPHPAIKSAIHFYLARHGILRPERVMHDLQSEHLGLKAAAILTLKTASNAFQFPSFYSLASEKLRSLLESKQEQEVCLALQIIGLEKNPKNLELIFSYLKHPSLSVNRAAGKALSLSAHPDYPDYSKRIIARLAYTQDSEVRLYSLQALEKLAGPEAIYPLILASTHFRPIEHKYVERIILSIEGNVTPTLVQIVENRGIADRCRLLAGKILGKLDRKILQKRLFDIVTHEIERAYFYFYHAQTIQKQVPEHDLSILQKALLTGYHSIIDFIIQLLGVAGSLEECEILSHTLRSQNRKIRAQAVESLEKTCNARLFALLEPLIDDRHPEEKLRLYLKEGGIPLNLTQLLDAMSHSPSRTDQIISLAMKAQLKTPDWRFTLREKLESNEEIFHHFASELLEGHHA